MKITLLVDDQPTDKLQSEFGLAMLLEQNGDTLLFDTGQASALEYNLRQLKIAPAAVKRVFLSHAHYDHSGGLAFLQPELIWHGASCGGKKQYSYHAPDDIHDISMPEAACRVFADSAKHSVSSFEKITPYFYSTGPIPRNSFEDCGGRFFADKDCTEPDNVAEEQALLSRDGVLISGCCHSGIINTLSHCRRWHPEITVHTIVGGLHLRCASRARLLETADFLRKNQLKRLFLMHCTGANAVASLQKLLPEVEITVPMPGQSWEC